MSLLPVRVVRLVLPYPPRANRYWRIYQGIARPSSIAKAYKKAVRELVLKRLGQPLSGPLRMEVDVFRPRKSGDVDGHVKVLFDSLQRDEEEGWPGLYLNDAQAVRVRVEHWDHQPKRARVQLTVTEDLNPRTPPQDWPVSTEEQALLDQAHAAMAEITAQENARAKARKEKRTVDASGPARAAKKSKKDITQLARSASYAPRRGERR